jgi:DNA-binding NtrC family response regulator
MAAVYDDQVRLVLIDDDPGVLRALGLVLKALRFDVTPFSDPVEALSFLRDSPKVDLVITDLRMPQISGAEVAQGVRNAGLDMPVVIMSGHATASEIAGLKEQGASGFIPKPFTPEALLRAVDALLPKRDKVIGS